MPFKTFVAGEILTAADVNSFLGNQAIAVFADSGARGSAIASPVEGQFSYLTGDDVLEFWDGSAWTEYVTAVNVDFLLISGGGGGGSDTTGDNRPGGGGGGGGFSEDSFTVGKGDVFTVKIGAGGAVNSQGTFSRVGGSYMLGGGSGGGATRGESGGPGSSGGGNMHDGASITGTQISTLSIVGFRGGASSGSSATLSQRAGGGGGGQTAVGGNGTTTVGGAGGAGRTATLTGSPYGGGGGGGSGATGGTGGTGGGGNGGSGTGAGSAGTANTGGGGGGSGRGAAGGTGGSGVLVLKYPDNISMTVGAGLTADPPVTAGGFTTLTITAGEDTVTVV
jgi:hypothetical protein